MPDTADTKAPRVSVIIPTYNRARYLGEAIDSALGQTFCDLEVLVVDDASTDDTAAVLARYGERIRVIGLERNGGPSAARNAGLAAARGDLIAFLDSDDVWLPDKLARQVQALDGDPTADGVTGRLAVYDDTAARELAAEPLDAAMSTLLLRSRAAALVGPFDETLRLAEDIDYGMRMRGLRLLRPSWLVGRYRLHPGNISLWSRDLAQATVLVYERWAPILTAPEVAPHIRRTLAAARYRLAVIELESPGRDRVAARLFVQAALADPLVDARLPGRRATTVARAWQLAKPWLAAATSLLGLGRHLRSAAQDVRNHRSRRAATP